MISQETMLEIAMSVGRVQELVATPDVLEIIVRAGNPAVVADFLIMAHGKPSGTDVDIYALGQRQPGQDYLKNEIGMFKTPDDTQLIGQLKVQDSAEKLQAIIDMCVRAYLASEGAYSVANIMNI